MTEVDYDCSYVIDISEEPRHHLVIANEFVRAFAVEIAPHQRTLCHRHPYGYFLYVASGAEIISASPDQEPKQLKYNNGECELSSAGLVHVVQNLSDMPFRNVVVELLPKARELRSGSLPQPSAADAQIRRVLTEEPGSVYEIDIGPAAEIAIAGPAVIAAPAGGLLGKEVDHFNIALDGFRKLIWVCAPRTVALKNDRDQPTRALVFQLGLGW